MTPARTLLSYTSGLLVALIPLFFAWEVVLCVAMARPVCLPLAFSMARHQTSVPAEPFGAIGGPFFDMLDGH